MTSTKQKIVSTALRLFNDSGISNVSLRTIADEAGISVGNLQYHFKKREDIVETLYFELVEKIDGIAILQTDNLLKSLFTISADMFLALRDYHFFLLDFVHITRRNETIKTHYAELSKKRENQFLQMAGVLIEYGLFRAEMIKNEYQNLYKRTEVISNFWFSSLFLQSEERANPSVERYSLVVAQSIYPYLTEEGRNQYVTIFPSQFR